MEEAEKNRKTRFSLPFVMWILADISCHHQWKAKRVTGIQHRDVQLPQNLFILFNFVQYNAKW